MKFSSRSLLCFSFLFFLLASSLLLGADNPLVSNIDITNPEGVQQPSVVTKMSILAGFALLPFAIMLLTSFLKFAVVLSLLRNAIGVQQTPPNQAINGIALIMSIYVMFPTGLAMYNAGQTVIHTKPPKVYFLMTLLTI